MEIFNRAKSAEFIDCFRQAVDAVEVHSIPNCRRACRSNIDMDEQITLSYE